MTDDLIQALMRAIATKQALDKCYAECEYDASYFCGGEQVAHERACIAVSEALGRIVDAQIAAYHGDVPPRPDPWNE